MSRPNVLLVVLDQLRYDCVGFSRQYPVRTPNIDRLAQQATWFRNSFTPIPTCCPARQSFLTGKRAETIGTLWNYDMGSKVPSLDEQSWTWTKALSASGYRTAYVGKWHASAEHGPQTFGFDSFTSEADYDDFRAEKYPDVAYRDDYIGEPDPLPLADTRTHWLARHAAEKIEELAAGTDPFMVRLDLSEPHLPCRPAEPFASMFTPEDVPPWASFGESFADKPYIQRQQLLNWRIEDFGWSDWAPIVARYYAVIAQVDDAVGRVLQALKRAGAAEDTAVILTADHGDMCGGHRMMDKHYVLYDDVVHVPLVIRLPGQETGRVAEPFVSNLLDLPPTVLSLAGLAVPDDLHGMDLLPLLRGDEAFEGRSSIVSTYNGQQFGLFSQRMLRNARWKYIWNATDVDELYDLESDPAELTNLAGRAEHQDRLNQMRRELHAELEPFDSLVRNVWLRDQLLAPGRKLGPVPLGRPEIADRENTSRETVTWPR